MFNRNLRWYHHVSFGVVALVIVALVVGLIGYNEYKHEHTSTGTICSTQAVTNSKGGHTYMVYTSTGTYDIKDHVVDGIRTTSANLYGVIQQYDTYRIKYYGFRNGWMSLFPNILSVKLISTNESQGKKICANSA
jgi:hypothetical protein